MQSSEHSKWPDESKRDGTRHPLALAFLCALAVVSLLAGVAFAAAGTPAALPYCALFAAILALTAALGWVLRNDGRSGLAVSVSTVLRDGAPATRIASWSTPFVLLVALMATCAAFCVLAAIGIVIHDPGSDLPVASAVAGAIGAFCASFLAAAALRRVRRGQLTLTAQGIEHRGWSFESGLAWSDIAGVKPAFNGHPVILVIGYANAEWHRRYTTRLWRIDRLPPVPMIEVDCRKFNVDRNALFEYLRLYVDHPPLRTELGTDAALARASA